MMLVFHLLSYVLLWCLYVTFTQDSQISAIAVGVYWAHVYRGTSRGPCIGSIYTHPSRVGGIEQLFPSLVAVNFHDAFFFFLCICRLEGSSLQVHMPYAKSYRIFPFLKFVCFRNMNYVYAKVNLKYIWMCQSVGPQMKPTFPPAGGLLTLLVMLLYSSICLKYIWLEYYCQILRILIRLCM